MKKIIKNLNYLNNNKNYQNINNKIINSIIIINKRLEYKNNIITF